MSSIVGGVQQTTSFHMLLFMLLFLLLSSIEDKPLVLSLNSGENRSRMDTWLKEFDEAMKLADDISSRLRERDLIVSSGGDPSQLISSTRRKITVLGTCLDRLESLLQNPPEKPRIDEEELYRRQDMLVGVRFKTKQMASSFSTSPSNRTMITNVVEPAEKQATEPVSVTHGIPIEGRRTREYLTTDITEDTSLNVPLLSGDNSPSESQPKENVAKNPFTSCSLPFVCLVVIGILIILLLIWTIIRICLNARGSIPQDVLKKVYV